MGHLYHGYGNIPLSSHYSPLLTIKSPFSYGKPEAMLVKPEGKPHFVLIDYHVVGKLNS